MKTEHELAVQREYHKQCTDQRIARSELRSARINRDTSLIFNGVYEKTNPHLLPGDYTVGTFYYWRYTYKPASFNRKGK